MKSKLAYNFNSFRIIDYPKNRKHNEAYRLAVNKFLTECNKLFDIYLQNEVGRKDCELRQNFIMTNDEYEFLEDQRTARQGKNLSSVVKPNESECRFKKSTERKKKDQNQKKK